MATWQFDLNAVQLDGNNGYCIIANNDLSLNLSAVYNANVGGSNNLIVNNLE